MDHIDLQNCFCPSRGDCSLELNAVTLIQIQYTWKSLWNYPVYSEE